MFVDPAKGRDIVIRRWQLTLQRRSKHQAAPDSSATRRAFQQWRDKWGFKISTEKTVAVLFSQATQRLDIKLHINGRLIKTEKSARFIGVVFDQHLTYTWPASAADGWTWWARYQARCGERLRSLSSPSKALSSDLSAQDSAARRRLLRQLWRSRNYRALSHQRTKLQQLSRILRPTEDKLHITDDPPRQVTVLEELRRLNRGQLWRVNHGSKAWRRTQLIGNPTLTFNIASLKNPTPAPAKMRILRQQQLLKEALQRIIWDIVSSILSWISTFSDSSSTS